MTALRFQETHSPILRSAEIPMFASSITNGRKQAQKLVNKRMIKAQLRNVTETPAQKCHRNSQERHWSRKQLTSRRMRWESHALATHRFSFVLTALFSTHSHWYQLELVTGKALALWRKVAVRTGFSRIDRALYPSQLLKAGDCCWSVSQRGYCSKTAMLTSESRHTLL